MENQGTAKSSSDAPALRIFCEQQLVRQFPALQHVCFDPSLRPKQLLKTDFAIESSDTSRFVVSTHSRSFTLNTLHLERWLSQICHFKIPSSQTTVRLQKAIKKFVSSVVDANLMTNKHHSLTTFLGRVEARELEKSWRSPQMLPRVVLKLNDFNSYETCQLIIHERGRTFAESWCNRRTEEEIFARIKTNDFNQIFKTVKKSKSKLFDQGNLNFSDLQIVGHFLAHAFSFKNYSALLFLSRDGFLPPSNEEINSFEILSQMIMPYLERQLIQEQSDELSHRLVALLRSIPIQTQIVDTNNNVVFSNFHNTNSEDDLSNRCRKIRLSNGHAMLICDSNGPTVDLDHYRRVTMLGDLLNTLQHELNNPLFGLDLGAEDLRQSSHNNEIQQTLVDISESAKRCQTIIKTFSTLYSDQHRKQRIDLRHFLQEIFILTKSEIRGIQKHIEFLNFSNEEDYFIELNLTSFTQILFNLIINAAQAINNSDSIQVGMITLQVRKAEDHYEFSLIDNGPGLSPEFKTNLNKPFFTTKQQGTGLGLTIVRSLLDTLGSQLLIEDNPQQRGAIFKFKLAKLS